MPPSRTRGIWHRRRGQTTVGFTAFDYFHGIARGGDFLEFMPTILGGALALAIIASIDALLCAKLVTAPGEPRRDGDRLLFRLGAGNVAAACIGGITGGINIGASIGNRSFGGRRSLSVLISAAGPCWLPARFSFAGWDKCPEPYFRR
jgi:MFS superfamily sulfate permease-like transporter